MSARPGLYGGQPAMVVPTVINSNRGLFFDVLHTRSRQSRTIVWPGLDCVYRFMKKMGLATTQVSDLREASCDASDAASCVVADD
jgi:hypothetical protein